MKYISYKIVKIFMSFISIFFISGCTPSLVYDPSLNLPPEPLKGGEFHVTGGVVMLPEARPEHMKEKVALGHNFTIRYSPFDRFTLQVRGWKDRSHNLEEKRSGISYSNIILMNSENSIMRIGFIPTGAILFVDGNIEGGGGAAQLAFWLPSYRSINPYLALGAGFGIRDITDNKDQWGWGHVVNIGISTKIIRYFTMNLEATGIKQVNEYEKVTHYIFAPSFNIGFQL